jgi:MarR-like DNA-binding transcriptional regulator SgrR of sgrS sRNA
MKKETHYLTFYEKWGPKEVDLYMADIADHLRCSVRHAKTIIKQLHKKGW